MELFKELSLLVILFVIQILLVFPLILYLIFFKNKINKT
jgi:hypothetical protein